MPKKSAEPGTYQRLKQGLTPDPAQVYGETSNRHPLSVDVPGTGTNAFGRIRAFGKGVAIAAAVLSFSIPPKVSAKTTGELLRECEDEDLYRQQSCLSYTEGVIDHLFSANGVEKFVCLPSGVTKGQVVEMFTKNANSNPEWWHLTADQTIADAIFKEFKCPGAK